MQKNAMTVVTKGVFVLRKFLSSGFLSRFSNREFDSLSRLPNA